MTGEELLQVKQRFGIIGNAPALNNAIDVAYQVASTDLSVLVTGESGSGKESFPQIIHYYSARKHGPYQPVNCAAIPEGTIDSELFGHEKGAFTGAIAERKGYFEVADGGTIFLDEVADLPSSTQARLLRVLESGEFIRVGSSKVQKTDVRVVAATNRNMSEAIKTGRFRADLFYRLNAIPIYVPPLRERPADDILRLFGKFTSDVSYKYKMPNIHLTDEAKSLLVNYRWPGNIRELKNVAERVSVLETQREIPAEVLKEIFDTSMDRMPVLYNAGGASSADNASFSTEREILYKVLFDMKKDMNDLKSLVHNLMQKNGMDESHFQPDALTSYEGDVPSELLHATPLHPTQIHPLNTVHKKDITHIQEASEYVEESMSLEDMEKEAIRKALDRNKGRRKNAAADLNISERTLYRKIKEYDLN